MKHIILLALVVYQLDCRSQTMPGMKMNGDRQNVYLAMMDTMMAAMSKGPGAATTGEYFLLQMIPHHEGALTMADYEIGHGKNFGMKQVAKNIYIEQKNEIQLMRMWLTCLRNDNKITTAYKSEMDETMRTMMSAMPNEKSLVDPDRSFALVMIPHHQAGIDMAKIILKYGDEEVLRSYAMQLISDQMTDIAQMKDLLKYKP